MNFSNNLEELEKKDKLHGKNLKTKIETYQKKLLKNSKNQDILMTKNMQIDL